MNFMYCITRYYQNLSCIAMGTRKCAHIIDHSDFYAMSEVISENKIYENAVSSGKHDKVKNNSLYKGTEYNNSNVTKSLKAAFDEKRIFCSFEVSPTKNTNFYQSFFTEMNKYHPLFYSLTWKMKDEINNYLSLEVLDQFPNNTLLHLTICFLTRADILFILKKALDIGVINIFVLRGDSKVPNKDFPYAVDLVRFIRDEFGNRFCICVAGYPEVHPESPSKELDLLHLKDKVDAGADFIITQIVFDADVFITFVNDCKAIGINVPIIPGILPIPNYACLEKMMKICNVKVPENISKILEPIKFDDDKVRDYGIKLVTSIIKDVISSGTTCGFHLFTLNRPSLSSEICDKLKMFQ
ncbi:methylenetetrahydrofolate reductase (NADPH) [Megalopta genalis]|uniref:methylenetetrahydrofolate reductase (NADPH) n=1 Tax=Megalopta genalis TaxID=115081 RepID=UPI003FD4252C